LSGRVLRIRRVCEKQCGTYQWSEIGRLQGVLLKLKLHATRNSAASTQIPFALTFDHGM
jgi:hypothetical protein